MVDDTKWSPVLRRIYLEQDDWDTREAALDYLTAATKMEYASVERVLTFLEDMDLVTPDGGPRLTTEGFHVIRNREIQEEQVKTNRILLAFTAILALASLGNLVLAAL